MHMYRYPESSTWGRKWHQTLFSQVPPFMAISIMLYCRFQGSSHSHYKCKVCALYWAIWSCFVYYLRLFSCHSFLSYYTLGKFDHSNQVCVFCHPFSKGFLTFNGLGNNCGILVVHSDRYTTVISTHLTRFQNKGDVIACSKSKNYEFF